MNQLSGVPSTKDIELAEYLAKLKSENNNNNNNSFPTFLPPPPLPPTPPPSPLDADNAESDDDDDDDDDNRNLAPTQTFLHDQPQRTAVAVGTDNAAMNVPLQEQKVRFSENFSKVFPEGNDIIESD